jgi:adenylate cyclase class 2
MDERFEVEVKCAVLRTKKGSEAERSARSVRERVLSAGAVPKGERHQSDVYLEHPCRDLASTDESVRARREREGTKERIVITYKGPKVSPRSKTRAEHELTMAEGTGLDEVLTLFRSIGFNEVRRVEKSREVFELKGVELSIDRVEGLGVFVEAEKVSSSVPEAESEVMSIMDSLGLADRERRSYLEMILEG